VFWYVHSKVVLSLSQIIFQNPNKYRLGNFQRFCYNSLCDLSVIFEQISNEKNAYLSSRLFWTVISLVIFYQLPSVSRCWIPPEYLIGSEPHSTKLFAPILVFMSQIVRLWNKMLCNSPFISAIH